MSDFRRRASSIAERLRDRMKSSPADGLSLFVFRLMFGNLLLLWVRLVYLPLLFRLERPARWLVMRMTPNPADEHVYWMSIDLYKATMTVISIGLYAIVSWAHGIGGSGHIVAGIAAAFVLVRLGEYVGTVGLLFFSRPSQAVLASYRPVANALWSYLEIALLFGILSACICVFSPDSISAASGERPVDSFFGPIYFSFTTIATTSGDFTPHGSVARIFAMMESFIGLVMVVAIIQKALSRLPAAPA